jgi:NAD(P)-dependent dehydrogenase (short-subunit alcohol dehydrogenase family)
LAFSESLVEELRGSGVTVTALCPPPVRTPFVEEAKIATANFMANTKVTPAEVAGYGYRMMKRGKPVAVYSLRYKILTAILRESYAPLWFASAAWPLERARCPSIAARRACRQLTAMSTERSATPGESTHVLGHADIEVQRLLLQGRP